MPECGANAMLDTTCQRFLLEGCFGFQDRVDMAGSSLQLCKASPGVGRVRSGLIGSDRVTIEQALHLINIAASMWKGALVHIDLVKRPRRSYTLLFLWILQAIQENSGATVSESNAHSVSQIPKRYPQVPPINVQFLARCPQSQVPSQPCEMGAQDKPAHSYNHSHAPSRLSALVFVRYIPSLFASATSHSTVIDISSQCSPLYCDILCYFGFVFSAVDCW